MRYELVWYTHEGVRKGVIQAFNSLEYIKTQNAIGGLVAEIPRGLMQYDQFSVGDIFEVWREKNGVLLPKDHPLARRAKLQLRDLAATPFVLFPRQHNPGFYDRVTRGFSATPAVGMAFCRARIVDGHGRRRSAMGSSNSSRGRCWPTSAAWCDR